MEAALKETGLPICLHLDHGDSLEPAILAWTAVYIRYDRRLPPSLLEENIAVTKRVVEYAHDRGVVVEASLRLAGVEDEVQVSLRFFTQGRKRVYVFAKQALTACDRNRHKGHGGAFKFKGEPEVEILDILEKVTEILRFSIVLHGASLLFLNL